MKKTLLLFSILFTTLTSAQEKEIDYCSHYGIDKDKFSNKVTYRSNSVKNISFVKLVENKTTNVYMSISIIGSTVNVGEKGVYLLFDDGTKIIKKEVEINVESTSKGFEYSAFFKINKNDLSILKTKFLTDFKLFIYDDVLKSGDASDLREYAKCLDKLN